MAKNGGARPGAGRKKGVPNKLTQTLKAAVAEAFDAIGGVEYLKKMAIEEPKAFMGLLGKCIPKELTGELDVNLTARSAFVERLQKARERAESSNG